MEVEETKEFLINNSIATQEEIELVCDINGYSIETLNDILYARTGYRYIEQMKEE